MLSWIRGCICDLCSSSSSSCEIYICCNFHGMVGGCFSSVSVCSTIDWLRSEKKKSYWYNEAHQNCARRPSPQGTLPVWAGRGSLRCFGKSLPPSGQSLAVQQPLQRPRTLSSSPNLLARHRSPRCVLRSPHHPI